MIPWVILLRMHIFSALCDPWGSCDDEDQSVAGGKAAWGGLAGAQILAILVKILANITRSPLILGTLLDTAEPNLTLMIAPPIR